jgi:ketosteroid isomerase-like protein
MSQEDLEIVRRTIEAFNRDGVEAAIEYLGVDIDWVAPPEWLEESVYRGHEGIRRIAAQWTENFDQYRLSIEELIDVGDRVLALLVQRGRIKESGDPIEQRIGHVWEVRDGKGVHVEVYFSWEQACEAAKTPGV